MVLQMYDVLKREYGVCPPDCVACEEACIKQRGSNAAGSAIKVIHVPEVNFRGVVLCNQCNQPRCREVCPTGAIIKSEADGTVRIMEEKCVGCGLCTLACPYGGISYDTKIGKSFKCDRCDGEPKCVEACPYGVLSFDSNSRVYHQLGEDVLTQGSLNCPACGAELNLRLILRIFGDGLITFGCAGCSSVTLFCMEGIGGLCGQQQRYPSFMCLMTNVASVMTGVRRYYKKMGKEVRTLAFVGDGATSDVGFQNLSGAAERGENIIYICNDNEAYMATGIQRSGTTPLFSWTTTTPVGEYKRGKVNMPKYVPFLLASHSGVSYVATATISHLEDFIQKLEKAKAVKEGMVYLHLFSPCVTGWKSPSNSTIEISRMAVETNYFPLWEAEDGKFRFTYEPKRPKPVGEFTRLMGRFSHLTEQELGNFQDMVDSRLDLIRHSTKRR